MTELAGKSKFWRKCDETILRHRGGWQPNSTSGLVIRGSGLGEAAVQIHWTKAKRVA
jgi:hypothetical protein